MERAPKTNPPKALLISRAGADADLAAVIAAILEAAGYTAILQQWDFANRNFMERMHAALAEGARVVALLSPEYLRSDHCQAEWQNAIADDPLNTKSRLILLRVAECEPVGLLSGLAYWDVVPMRDNRALLESTILSAVREDRRESSVSGRYWRAPRTIVDAEAIRPVPGFSGREEELLALSTALSNAGAIAAVHGLGGVGKSSVAREYAWRSREKYSVIWWLNAQTEDAIIDGLLRLGALFVRGLDQHADRRAAAQQVTSSMLSGFAKPVLLIFDNLEDERLLRTWLPRSGTSALATSRNAAWSAGITAVALPIWSLATAIGYLQRESGRADLTEADARAISEALGALPLALAHAAASLREMRMVTPGRYLERVSERLKKAPRTAEYPLSVFATFSTAILQAENEAAGAAAVLCFAASFAPDAIPDELFRQPIGNYPAELQPELSEGVSALDLRSTIADELLLDEALGALDRLSLLTFSESSCSYNIHRLVQLAARDIVPNALAWQQCAVVAANAAFPEVEFATWPQCYLLLPHARAALSALPGEIAMLSAGRLANRCASYLRDRGLFDVAEPLLQRALAIFEHALAADHPDVSASLNDLATLYYLQGRYDEAEPLLKRALTIRETTLAGDHPDIATSLNDLAFWYYQQGRYSEAESLHARALTIREKALAPDHPDVATSLNDLGVLYHRQGRFGESEAHLARALAIRTKALGPDHPEVATSLNDLANLHFQQEHYEETEPLLNRALVIWEKALGPDHPEVATSLNNLGLLYNRQARFEEAEPLNARALAIREKALGPDHPNVAHSLNSLAVSYHRLGRFDEAEPLLKRALAVREKVLGPDHPDVATSLSDLANLYAELGRQDETKALLERALAIRENALGPDHPHVAASLNDLGRLYEAEARLQEAEPLYARALAIREKVLGSDHALTRAAREELTSLRSRR